MKLFRCFGKRIIGRYLDAARERSHDAQDILRPESMHRPFLRQRIREVANRARGAMGNDTAREWF